MKRSVVWPMEGTRRSNNIGARVCLCISTGCRLPHLDTRQARPAAPGEATTKEKATETDETSGVSDEENTTNPVTGSGNHLDKS